jgi:hypothetical protein
MLDDDSYCMAMLIIDVGYVCLCMMMMNVEKPWLLNPRVFRNPETLKWIGCSTVPLGLDQ